MAGYNRTDTTNNIATGNIINASDLDAEYDAIDAAFDEATGHVHDGSSGNGAPITKVGPVQDLVISNTAVTPKINNTLDLGTSSLQFKDAYIDGTAYIDALDLNGTLVTPTATELNFVDGVTSAIQTQLDNKQPLDAQLTDIAGLTPTDNAVIIGNGTNFVAESGATARTSLGLAIGTDVQAYDAELAALAGLTSAANKLPYFTGSGTAAVADLTSFGRSLIDDADAATARTTLGLVIGTDVQAYDAELAALSGLTPADNAIIVGNGTTFVTESGATARTSLGLAIGTDVQAYDAQLADIAGLTPTDNGIVIGNGSNFVVETGATARTSLGLAIGTDVQAYDADLTTLGAGGSSARSFLGLAIGTDVQAYDAQLADVAGLTPTDNGVIIGNGTNFVVESGSTVRTSLGLGTAATTASTDYATAAQGTNADTAFGWGNHASAGYVTSADPAGTAVALAIALG
jgi:hypothetical protein